MLSGPSLSVETCTNSQICRQLLKLSPDLLNNKTRLPKQVHKTQQFREKAAKRKLNKGGLDYSLLETGDEFPSKPQISSLPPWETANSWDPRRPKQGEIPDVGRKPRVP
jgi:hypothetical protein